MEVGGKGRAKDKGERIKVKGSKIKDQGWKLKEIKEHVRGVVSVEC